MLVVARRILDTGSPGLGSGAGLFAYLFGLGIAVVALAAAFQWAFGFSHYSSLVALCYAPVATAIAIAAVKHFKNRAFGAANQVTMVRVGLTVLVACLLIVEPSAPVAWLVVALAVVSLILDGVDGKLARQFGQETTFGARFDMETDAALILILTIFCWQLDKSGVWIIAAGMLRYLFAAATSVFAFMRQPLPPSRRRQTVCVVQILGLLLMVSPVITRPTSTLVGTMTLTLLVASFAIDVAWLAAKRPQPMATGRLD